MAIAGNLLPVNAESIETDASAWSALVNATGLVKASGGTLGANCLLFKSVASGDTQVGLTSRVNVTPGAEHWACASIFPPAVGAQSRIEIRWYTSGGSLISTSQGPLVTASAAAWHQVGAIGTAPATAATANVVIRATATAASQSWFTDRVFLGLTSTSTSLPGNLLPFNTESFEIDSTGWSATTNCSLSLSTAAYAWYQSLLVTATASGEAVATTSVSQAPAVTPGLEYVAQAYVTPGVAGAPVDIRIYWRDSGGTDIGTSSATWTPAASQWTRIVVAGTAPANAAAARVVVAPTATAAGQQWAIDRVVLVPSSILMTPGNLLPYNVSDIEVSSSGWAVTGATATQTTEQGVTGAYSLKMVSTGGDLVATIATPVSITPELGYQFAPCIRQSGTRTYQTRIEWLDVSGSVVRTRWQSWLGVANNWLLSPMGDLAPDSAVSARLSVIIPDATAGESYYLDRISWTIGGLTTKAEPAPGGGAAITVRGLTTGGPTWTWSLARIITGQAPQPVRGWNGDLTSQTTVGDIAVATDYEAPLGVAVQWRASTTDGSASFSYLSDPITLDAEATDVWLKDPGLPQRSTSVTVATPMPSWSRASRQGVNQVRGRARPVVISDVRAGKTGDLTVVTQTDADRDALWWVLETGNTLLLQWPPGWGEEDMYVTVGDVQAAPIVDYAEFHDRTWVLPLTEVDRPTGGITGSASRIWQDMANSASSWADALVGAASWLDVYTGE